MDIDEQEQRDIMQAAEAVGATLRRAVGLTISERSPEPARVTIAEVINSGAASPAPDGSNPATLMTSYLLVGWLNVVREELAEQSDRITEILGWIEEALGKRYRLRARYTSGALESESGLEELGEYADALGPDFLPSLIWLLAGAVARYGDGDAEWLEQLQNATAG